MTMEHYFTHILTFYSIYTHTHTHTHTHKHTCIQYTYIYIYTHTHTHTHTYIYSIYIYIIYTVLYIILYIYTVYKTLQMRSLSPLQWDRKESKLRLFSFSDVSPKKKSPLSHLSSLILKEISQCHTFCSDFPRYWSLESKYRNGSMNSNNKCPH